MASSPQRVAGGGIAMGKSGIEWASEGERNVRAAASVWETVMTLREQSLHMIGMRRVGAIASSRVAPQNIFLSQQV